MICYGMRVCRPFRPPKKASVMQAVHAKASWCTECVGGGRMSFQIVVATNAKQSTAQSGEHERDLHALIIGRSPCTRTIKFMQDYLVQNVDLQDDVIDTSI